MLSEKKAKKTEEKEMNRNAIYNLIRTHDKVSKQDILHTLQLSLPTVNLHIQSLADDGLICESGLLENTGGRKARAFSCELTKKIALGVEITPNHISVVALNLRGEMIDHIHVREVFLYEASYFQTLGHLIHSLLDKIKLKPEQVLGVGIAIPGLVSDDNQTVVVGPILGITGMTVDRLRPYLSYPIRLYNDSNAACFAEYWNNKHMNNSFFITLGHHIGGSVLIQNSVYIGENSRSGEVGHMTLYPNGLPCYCGKKGCFDSYCSATVLSQHTDGNLDRFFRMLDLGEEPYVSIWKEYMEHLSVGVNNVRMLFDCEVILGGYVGTYIEKYMEELKQLIAEKNTFENSADYLHSCKFKYEAFATGAGLPFVQDFLESV